MNNRHLIIGAGNFSHAHIRTLNELSVKEFWICRKSNWSNTSINEFTSRYQENKIHFVTLDETVNNNKFDDMLAIVVTPSETHLDILSKLLSFKRIFLEKPAVLFLNQQDFILAKKIHNEKQSIYHNDWLAQINQFRKNQDKPKTIAFTYDVKDTRKINHVTEIISHLIGYLSMWCPPDCKIDINHYDCCDPSITKIKFFIDEIDVSVSVSNGKVPHSVWSIIIDDELFTNETLGGKLMLNTLNTMLIGDTPLTNWYKTSWLIYKFQTLETPDVFENQYNLYY